MSNELQLFNEDVTEQLNFMELALIKMQEEGANEEDIGAVFRAMHTIKGTAGMFGFDNVVSFAHIAENLLSEVREGNVTLTEEMIELFLQTKDHAEVLINGAINDIPLDNAVRENNDRLVAALIALMPSSSAGALPPQETEGSNTPETEEETESSVVTWHISIRFHPDFFSTGMDILSILSFLDVVGKVTKILPIIESIPELEAINPVEAYIGFEIQLEMDKSAYDEIEEVFEFVMDDIDLLIFKVEDEDALKGYLERPDIKELLPCLIEKGLFTQSEVETSTPAKVEKTESDTPPTAPKIETPPTEPKVETQSTTPQTDNAKKSASTNKSFSLRVDSSKVDHLINQISEMVIANAKITQRADILDDNELSESAIIMSDMLEEIRSGVMNIRMVQVGDTFSKFKRIVNDATKQMGKDIHFTIEGEDTELDKMVVEKISDPIMHMLRNSVDHGIEMPEDRIKANKPSQGNISLSAYPDAGTIVIEIKDDGKGLDKDAILAKAVTNGLIKEGAELSDKEIFSLIFEPGLSTAKSVSNISGRGVGMDVVRRNIEDLRGTVSIESEKGVGSRFVIRLPLTLAIIDGFLIQSGKTKYIIPLEMIQECIELDAKLKAQMKGNQFINLRDSILPLLNIRDYFKEEDSESIRENVVVVKYGDYHMGMQVDELYGEFQTVIKPLGEVFSKIPGISGGTILGSGEIALIFDIPKLMEYKIRESG